MNGSSIVRMGALNQGVLDGEGSDYMIQEIKNGERRDVGVVVRRSSSP